MMRKGEKSLLMHSLNQRKQNMAAEKEAENRGKSTFVTKVKQILALFFGELIGTMILMFVGCSSNIDFDDDPIIPHHWKSLGFGFAVLLAMQVCAHITACHINPAVSLTSLLLGHINIITFVIYLVAQFLGSLLGFSLLKLLYPESITPTGFCMTKIGGGVTIVQGFFIEVVITCILCFVLCSVWDQRNANQNDSVAIRFAIIVSILSIIGGPLTGASMNTARSFGPAVFGSQADWKDQWVFWIAPNLSPFIAVGFYKLVFTVPDQNVDQNHTEENEGLST